MIVDSFAGGGGASLGVEMATGRSPDIAINHDAEALAMHRRNHPNTVHYQEDVWAVDPVAACQGRPVGLAWFSPDCTHHSRAKGGKPRQNRVRGLAWVAVRWARAVRPRIICLENVAEFQDWGPLVNGQPCPDRKGWTFRSFVAALEREGYRVEWRELVAADYGAPTIRRRLFLVARCDGERIVWPEPSHDEKARHGRLPWRTAAECIDWDIEVPSIFTPGRQLADNTLRRIARGIKRYIIDAAEPFIVGVGGRMAQTLERGVFSVPMQTVTTKGDFALCAAFLAKHYGGNESPGWDLRRALSTITTQDHHHLVMAFLIKYYGTDQDPRLDEPMHTMTTKHRFGLVTVHGEQYRIFDIGMRMLQPRELARAQGFPDGYDLETGADGKPLSKTAQVRMIGNSVCPPIAAALVSANYSERRAARRVGG